MRKVGLWQISEGSLTRIEDSSISLEYDLENWIENDPKLIQEDLMIIGRQLVVEGGRLDLLALDSQSRLVIIELKRSMLNRDTIAQVIDYASCFATMSDEDLRALVDPYLQKRYQKTIVELLSERQANNALSLEQRDFALIIVGTGRAPGLERVGDFISQKADISLTVITFDVYQHGGKYILAREISETSGNGKPITPSPDVMATFINDPKLKLFIDTAKDLAQYIHTRTYKASIMFTPPDNRTRMLFTVWATRSQETVKTYIGGSVFTEFYPVSLQSVQEHLGSEGWRFMTSDDVNVFVKGLRGLFAEIERKQKEEDISSS